jgi:hypothetical protein
MRGVGHVGKAFADRSVKITEDATQHGIAELMKPPPALSRPYDEATYRSYVCIPFGNDSDQADPCGVLVATSDRPGRFTNANHEILRQAAVVIGGIVSLGIRSAPEGS